MLLNISSMAFSDWDENQKKMATSEFETILDADFSFPESGIDEHNVKEAVISCIEANIKLFNNADRNNAVYIVGDELFTFYLVKSMLERGIRCITPLFDRSTDPTTVINKSSFIKFREYKLKY